MSQFLTISEMAKLHHISRQTLIHYDKIDLFTPQVVDELGYRYYHPDQIPILREICFLKSIGVKLKEIKYHMSHRDADSAISLLRSHQKLIDEELKNLLERRKSIDNRLMSYSYIEDGLNEVNKPFIEYFPERRIVFEPCENDFTNEEIQLTMMNIWNKFKEKGLIPSTRFGTMIMRERLNSPNPLEGAGVYIRLIKTGVDIENLRKLPAGQYVCMYRYGMPEDLNSLHHLLHWIEEQDYEITGDVIDACILDATFKNKDLEIDLRQLQIPIKRKEM
jgi:DNA-binding transcriptional MerR regulator